MDSSFNRRAAGTLAASAAFALLGASPALAADTTDPTISITSPTQGEVVSGRRSIAASARDGSGIARVEFRRGTKLLSSDSSSPYVHSWNTTLAPEGAHTLYARAIDRAGNSRTASVRVTVKNAPSVSFAAPTQGKTVAGTLSGADCAVAAEAPAGIARVEFFRDGVALNSDSTAPYSCSFDSRGVPDGAHTLSAKLVDSAGRTASSSVGINSDNSPSVSFTAPTQGQTIAGALDESSCSVAARSFVGVKQVEFSVDGQPLNTDLAAPYGCVLDSTQLADGAHTLRAKVLDVAGGSASAAVAVNVDNPGPVVVQPDPVEPPISGTKLNDWSRISMWDYVEEVSDDRVRHDSGVTRHPGGTAIRFEVRDGEHGNGGSSGERAEVRDSKTGIQRPGDNTYYGWSTRLGSSFSIDSSLWRSILQFHTVENEGASPSVSIRVGKGRFFLSLKSTEGTSEIDLGAANTTSWHDFVMRVKSSRSSSEGRVTVWKDGVLKVDRAHRTVYTDSVGNYIKAGIYRSNSYTNTDVAYLDGLEGWSTREGADPSRP